MCPKMKTFEDLQGLWLDQSNTTSKTSYKMLMEKAEKSLQKIKRNHIGTLLIIGALVSLLIYFFFWVNAFKNSSFSLGLFLMISSMLLRIFLEYFSLRKFKNINPSLDFLAYKTEVAQFYKTRKKIHNIYTPIIYIMYCIGFLILLPIFKASLSTGFFIYIVGSGVGFLTIFAFFLYKKIKEELALIAYLDSIY